jgi:carboxypeptidase family protein
MMVAALATSLAASTPLCSQAVITGVVKEDSTGRALGGVEVTIAPQRTARTDNGGRYWLEAPLGTYIALYRLIGYRPVQIRVDLGKRDTVHVDATMVRDLGQRLDSVLIPGRASRPRGSTRDGFAERRAFGLGKFIDSTILRRSESSRISEVLRVNTGVRMVNWQEQANGRHFGPVEIWAASPIAMSSDGGANCWATVIYDGVTMYRSGTGGRPPDFAREFSVSSLESIEYYKNATETPIEFSGGRADCGVLVLWSRRAR